VIITIRREMGVFVLRPFPAVTLVHPQLRGPPFAC
jgi:hypothetical protein